MSERGVVVDARALGGQPTGIGVWLAEITRRWSARGRAVVLLTPPAAGVVVPGAEVVELPAPFHLRAWRYARGRKLPYLSPDSMIVPTLLGRTATVTVHDLVPLLHSSTQTVRTRLAFRSLLAAATTRVGAVVVPSRATYDDLVARHPGAASRTHVVPEGARTLPPPVGLPAGVRSPYVLCTGTIEPRKRVVELAGAFVAAAPEPWQLVLAGRRGWLTADQAVRLDAAAATGRVVELGYVEDAQLAALLGAADAVAYPSTYEGFGLPVLEAMAAGVPVLTSTAPAIQEVGADAVAYVDEVQPFEPALARALAEFLEDDGRRTELRQRGLERAASFSWEAAAERVWSIVTADAPRR